MIPSGMLTFVEGFQVFFEDLLVNKVFEFKLVVQDLFNDVLGHGQALGFFIFILFISIEFLLPVLQEQADDLFFLGFGIDLLNKRRQSGEILVVLLIPVFFCLSLSVSLLCPLVAYFVCFLVEDLLVDIQHATAVLDIYRTHDAVGDHGDGTDNIVDQIGPFYRVVFCFFSQQACFEVDEILFVVPDVFVQFRGASAFGERVGIFTIGQKKNLHIHA